MYKQLISILFVLFSISVLAQDETLNVDKQTYELYNQAKWKELIRTGKKAYNKGVNFYYLPIRIGIAYFEKHNYQKAAKWFGKSYEGYKDNNIVNEYLYYSLLYSGNGNEAGLYAETFTSELQQKINFIESKSITQISYYFNYTTNQNLNELKSEPFSTGNITSRSALDNSYYHGITMIHKNSPAFVIKQSVSYMFINEYGQANLPNNVNTQSSLSTKQFVYSIGLYYSMLNKWNMYFSAHLLNYNKDIISVLPPPKTFANVNVKSNEMLISAGISKGLGNFNLGGSISYSGLNNEKQVQASGHLLYYPFGNLNFYAGINGYYQKVLQAGTGKNQGQPVFEPVLGLRVFKFYITSSYTVGNMSNFNKNDGFQIYNSSYTIKDMINVGLSVPVFKNKIQLSLYYQYQNNEGYSDIGADPVNLKSYSNQFNNKSITGGIIWNF